MAKIIVVLAVIALVWVCLRWFTRTAAADIRESVKRWLVWGCGLLLLYLVATGHLNWLLPVIGGLVAVLFRSLPHLLRFAPLLQRLWVQYRPRGGTGGPDDASTVETEFVRMTLDHERGEIIGEVLKGSFSGRTFSELDLRSLLQLRQEVQGIDDDAVALIESYLERIYPDEWRTGDPHGRERKQTGFETDGQRMSREEAFEVLGLAEGVSSEEVVQAHRRLMQKIHPDRGGSGYLASKINRARDVLLG